ncbi:MAG: DUF2726 domain-containing protein [Desulfobaccales bacterium]
MVDRRKKLFNPHEKACYINLTKIGIHFDVNVQNKMRIADVFNIKSSGLSPEEFTYALKAHFDFVIYDNEDLPLFGIELDGSLHEKDNSVINNDILKNNICERFSFPLLRINADFVTKKIKDLSLLSWIIEVWFLGQAFLKQQDQGFIPKDEIFDYNFVVKPFMKNGIIDGDFAYNLSRTEVVFINNCRREGVIARVNFVAYEDQLGFTHGIIVASIDDKNGIMSRVRVKTFNFYPPSPSDIVEDLVIIDIANKIKKHMDNKEKCIDPRSIYDFMNTINFKNKNLTFLKGFSF